MFTLVNHYYYAFKKQTVHLNTSNNNFNSFICSRNEPSTHVNKKQKCSCKSISVENDCYLLYKHKTTNYKAIISICQLRLVLRVHKRSPVERGKCVVK